MKGYEGVKNLFNYPMEVTTPKGLERTGDVTTLNTGLELPVVAGPNSTRTLVDKTVCPLYGGT